MQDLYIYFPLLHEDDLIVALNDRNASSRGGGIRVLEIGTLSGSITDTATDFGYRPDEVNTDSIWESGSVELKPGIQDAMVKVNFQRRNFRYYMPENL